MARGRPGSDDLHRANDMATSSRRARYKLPRDDELDLNQLAVGLLTHSLGGDVSRRPGFRLRSGVCAWGARRAPDPSVPNSAILTCAN